MILLTLLIAGGFLVAMSTVPRWFCWEIQITKRRILLAILHL